MPILILTENNLMSSVRELVFQCKSSTNALHSTCGLIHVALLKSIALYVSTITSSSALSRVLASTILRRILGDDTGLVVAQVGTATTSHCSTFSVLQAFRRAGGNLTRGWTVHGAWRGKGMLINSIRHLKHYLHTWGLNGHGHQKDEESKETNFIHFALYFFSPSVSVDRLIKTD